MSNILSKLALRLFFNFIRIWANIFPIHNILHYFERFFVVNKYSEYWLQSTSSKLGKPSKTISSINSFVWAVNNRLISAVLLIEILAALVSIIILIACLFLYYTLMNYGIIEPNKCLTIQSSSLILKSDEDSFVSNSYFLHSIIPFAIYIFIFRMSYGLRHMRESRIVCSIS